MVSTEVGVMVMVNKEAVVGAVGGLVGTGGNGKGGFSVGRDSGIAVTEDRTPVTTSDVSTLNTEGVMSLGVFVIPEDLRMGRRRGKESGGAAAGPSRPPLVLGFGVLASSCCCCCRCCCFLDLSWYWVNSSLRRCIERDPLAIGVEGLVPLETLGEEEDLLGIREGVEELVTDGGLGDDGDDVCGEPCDEDPRTITGDPKGLSVVETLNQEMKVVMEAAGGVLGVVDEIGVVSFLLYGVWG